VDLSVASDSHDQLRLSTEAGGQLTARNVIIERQNKGLKSSIDRLKLPQLAKLASLKRVVGVPDGNSLSFTSFF
jgi:hypothetical protein